MSDVTLEYVKGLENLIEDLQKKNFALSDELSRTSLIKEDMVQGVWLADDSGKKRFWTFRVGKLTLGILSQLDDGRFSVTRKVASNDDYPKPEVIEKKVSLWEAKRIALVYLKKPYDSIDPFWERESQ